MHLVSLLALLVIVPAAIAQCVNLYSPTIQVGSIVYPVDDCYGVQSGNPCDYSGAALAYCTYLGFKAAPNYARNPATLAITFAGNNTLLPDGICTTGSKFSCNGFFFIQCC